MSEVKVKKEKIWWPYFVAIFVVVFVLWLSTAFVVPYFTTEPGVFGDMFGSINALFSGFAFVGIIITLVYQIQELKLQRKQLILQSKDLELTRKELIRSANAQELLEESMREQVNVLLLTARLNAHSALANRSAIKQLLSEANQRHSEFNTKINK